MRALIVIVLAVISLAPATFYAGPSNTDKDQLACDELEGADADLNRVYRQVMTEYAEDSRFTASLREAQRAWITFRDLHVESRYPGPNKRAEYGSVYSTCHCLEMTELTEQRTAQLRRWLEGVEEGDVCRGSIRMKEE